eukprot:COSAG02_NODE_29293_length_572_cov_0.875264_1_plen_79_part_01
MVLQHCLTRRLLLLLLLLLPLGLATQRGVAIAPSPAPVCSSVEGIEGKLPHHFDETGAKNTGECCASCGSDSRCKFWSF